MFGSKDGELLAIMTVMFLIAALFAGFFYFGYSSASSGESYMLANQVNASALSHNYTALKTAFVKAQSNYTGLKSNYTTLQAIVSDPYYSETLYSDNTVIVPAGSYNYGSYSLTNNLYYAPGTYNLSYYAPYPGYIVFNETNNGRPNNQSGGYFYLYFSNGKPYQAGSYSNSEQDGGQFNSYVAPWTEASPANGNRIVVPVQNGTNYILFTNYNFNRSITVTFSAEYYGYKLG
jgi:hypothetical protein